MSAISSLSFGVVSALVKDLMPYPEPVYRFDRSDGMHNKRVDTGTIRPVRPREDQCQIFLFKQVWGSTSLGFGGIAGQAMTSAFTTVVIGPVGDACVYFGCRFAYHIKNPSQLLFEHIAACSLMEVSMGHKYENTGQ